MKECNVGFCFPLLFSNLICVLLYFFLYPCFSNCGVELDGGVVVVLGQRNCSALGFMHEDEELKKSNIYFFNKIMKRLLKMYFMLIMKTVF